MSCHTVGPHEVKICRPDSHAAAPAAKAVDTVLRDRYAAIIQWAGGKVTDATGKADAGLPAITAAVEKHLQKARSISPQTLQKEFGMSRARIKDLVTMDGRPARIVTPHYKSAPSFTDNRLDATDAERWAKRASQEGMPPLPANYRPRI